MSAALKLYIFNDAEALACAVAEEVVRAAEEAIAARGAFHLVLAGGSTPRRCYEILRTMPVDWIKVHIYFGDERCLPAGHIDRNDTMAAQALFNDVPLSAAQIHRIPAELGPETGAAHYDALLTKSARPDLVLLGMGEDGHTASLFPGNPALDDRHMAVPVYDAPKPPPKRISMGYSILNHARRRLVLVSGESKRDALDRIRAGERLPVMRLDDADWYVDTAAIGEAATLNH